MKQFTLPLLLILAFSCFVSAQRPNPEIVELVNALSKKLEPNQELKKVIIADFTNSDEQPTELSVYLSEQISLLLSSESVRIRVMDRKSIAEKNTKKNSNFGGKFQKMITTELNKKIVGTTDTKSQKNYTAAANTITVLDPQSFFDKGNKNMYKGIDAVIEGTLTSFADYYQLDLKVKSLHKKSFGEILTSRIGYITKNPSLIALAERDLSKKSISGGFKTKGPSNSIRYKKDLINFEVLGCSQVGQTIECEVEITNTGVDIELHAYPKHTRIIDAKGGSEYIAQSIRLADKIGSGRQSIKKTLIRNRPIKAVISFENIPDQIDLLSKLDFHCHTQTNGEFKTDLRNIPVQ